MLLLNRPSTIKFILHFGTHTENKDGSYFGMDGSALSPSRGQKNHNLIIKI